MGIAERKAASQFAVLTCLQLMGCVGGPRLLRQSVGPGPGPGCASSLDCACKNGSMAACEQLRGTPEGSSAPKPPEPKPLAPGPVLPPVTQGTAPEDETKKRCSEYYDKCIQAGGGSLPGHARGYSRCASCLGYCTANGFWPEAIYTWNGARLSCPGT
jgi:hypothetical protein